jgi:hypothetical protein
MKKGSVHSLPQREAASQAPAARAPEAGRARLAVEMFLVLFAALLALYRTREGDFWFHLAAGRDIVQHGLPHAERWCLAVLGQWPWLGEWLYHVALYGTRAAAGDWGVTVWRAAWTALAVAFALALARQTSGEGGPRAGLGTAALLATLALANIRERLAARPEQITMAFLLLFLLVFERARRAGRDRTLWLVPVQIVWVNMHPGWFLGPLVAALYALLEAFGRSAAARRRALRWLLVGLAFCAAGAVSPRPLDTLSLRLMRDARADPMMLTIDELKPWIWAEDRARPFTALLALAAAAAIVGGRRAWRASPPLTVAALGALAAGLVHARFKALGALVALPVLAAALATHTSPAPGTKRRRKLSPYLGTALAALAAVAGVAWLVTDLKYYPAGVAPLLDSVPVRAVTLADSLHIDGPVLNTPWYGGYIFWARGEKHLPLQDARFLGSAAFRSRLVRARLDPAALDTLLTEWRFTHAILEPAMSPLDRLAVQLFHRPEWALVFADDAGLLFVRRDLDSAWVAERAFRLLSPDYAEMGVLAARAQGDSALARALTAELLRARAESPWNARASLWLGLLALAGGRAQEALGYLDHVERLAPATPGLSFRQGYAHELLGEIGAAERAYRRALRDTSDAAVAREALERLGR